MIRLDIDKQILEIVEKNTTMTTTGILEIINKGRINQKVSWGAIQDHIQKLVDKSQLVRVKKLGKAKGGKIYYGNVLRAGELTTLKYFENHSIGSGKPFAESVAETTRKQWEAEKKKLEEKIEYFKKLNASDCKELAEKCFRLEDENIQLKERVSFLNEHLEHLNKERESIVKFDSAKMVQLNDL